MGKFYKDDYDYIKGQNGIFTLQAEVEEPKFRIYRYNGPITVLVEGKKHIVKAESYEGLKQELTALGIECVDGKRPNGKEAEQMQGQMSLFE